MEIRKLDTDAKDGPRSRRRTANRRGHLRQVLSYPVARPVVRLQGVGPTLLFQTKHRRPVWPQCPAEAQTTEYASPFNSCARAVCTDGCSGRSASVACMVRPTW